MTNYLFDGNSSFSFKNWRHNKRQNNLNEVTMQLSFLFFFFFLIDCVSQIGELLPFEWVSVNFASTGHLLSIDIYESL